MKLTYEEVVQLKTALIKAQRFDLAVKLREEEKRLFGLLPKKMQDLIRSVDTTTRVMHWVPANVKVQFPFEPKLFAPLIRESKTIKEIVWKETGNDPHDLFARPKRNHLMRVERLGRGIYWWAFYIGKSSFASYDVVDYGKSLEDAKEKCELYYYLKITSSQ